MIPINLSPDLFREDTINMVGKDLERVCTIHEYVSEHWLMTQEEWRDIAASLLKIGIHFIIRARPFTLSTFLIDGPDNLKDEFKKLAESLGFKVIFAIDWKEGEQN